MVCWGIVVMRLSMSCEVIEEHPSGWASGVRRIDFIPPTPSRFVLYSHAMTLTSGQPVLWLYPSKRGVIPILAKVANVVHDRVVLRVVKKATGEVYFKVVNVNQVRIHEHGSTTTLAATGRHFNP